MTKGFSFLCVVSLILGFQNCSQRPYETDQASLSLLSEGQQFPVEKISYIEVPAVASEAPIAGKVEASSSPLGTLLISTESGDIQLVDDGNNVLDKKCLPKSSLQELHSILEQSRLCSAKEVSEEVLCGQVYTPGYASLISNEVRIPLGEERDSCGSGRKDFCGDMAEVFKNYISYVKLHWQEMACE